MTLSSNHDTLTPGKSSVCKLFVINDLKGFKFHVNSMTNGVFVLTFLCDPKGFA